MFYDSLVAKLIAWGRDFEEARLRLRNALDEFVIDGVATTIPLHRFIVRDEEFINGNLSTAFLVDREIVKRMKDSSLKPQPQTEELAAVAASVFLSIRKGSPDLRQPKRPGEGRSTWKQVRPELNYPGESRYADAV
jgi:acetyl-CoA/propionyl-CoA carboxylase